jgi:iron complex outermembrane receptor protein
MRRLRNASVPFAATALALAISQQSFAQAMLEEVLVTAQKQEATLQDTPVAVSAFTNSDLRRSLVDRPLDLQLNVPNMLMSKGNFTTASISIRGIGNLAVGSAGDSGTGVHINGMYMNAPRVFEMEMYDVERVEVLRGPQGTLYGRNTTAGVLNMITAKPTDELGGQINAEYGNYNHFRTRGHINIPLTDNLQQRFAGFWFSRDGQVDNEFDGTEVDDREMFGIRSSTRWFNDSTEVNLMINYLEEDDSRMRGSDGRCTKDPAGILGCLPATIGNDITHSGSTITGALTGQIGASTGIPFPADDYANSITFDDPRRQYLDVTPIYQVEDTVVTLEIVHEMDDLTLTSLTGYHDTSFSGVNDYDFTQASEVWPITQIPAFPFDANGDGVPDGAAPNPFFCVPGDIVGQCASGGILVDRGPQGLLRTDRNYTSDLSQTSGDEWVQEIRLNSDFAGDLNFMLGGFYLRYTGDTNYYVFSSGLNLYGEINSLAGGPTLPLELQRYDNDTSDFTLETWAVFGELYYDLNERTLVTLGLRYSDETKEADQRTIYADFLDLPSDPNNGYEAFSWSNSEPTGRLNIQYDFSEDVMSYVQLSRSFKSGGFNPISRDSIQVQLDPNSAFFEPEFINAFEVGLKSRLLDGALQANVTYFYYDYEGLQVSKIVNQTSINENFDATIQGFEGEFAWAANENWLFTANLSWLDSELGGGDSIDPGDPNGSTYLNDGRGPTSGVASLGNANVYFGPDCPNPVPIPQAGGLPGCDGIPIDLTGNQIPGSPEFSANLGARYTLPLDSGAEFSAQLNYYWQDEFYSRVFNGVVDTVEEWDVWNSSLRYTAADNRWFVELWGRNLANDDFVTGQYRIDPSSGLGTNQFLLEPRTYGLGLTYVF